MALDPAGIPPFEGIHIGSADENREVQMIAAGQAKLVVDQVLPLSEVGKAHAHLANRGARGKVILTP